jgi:predicted ATP-grasp superfamily ATP-dependent carboligase
MALVDAGFTVHAVCPSRHPLRRTIAVQQVHDYHGLMPLRSLARTIAAAKPDLVLPCDDTTSLHLHDLYSQALRRGLPGSWTCSLIERSLGAPANFPILYQRTACMELAHGEGVRVPRSRVVTNTEDLKNWVAQTGFPGVLKSNRTSGGDGVCIVSTLEESERALRTLQAPPLFARAAKRALIDRDMALLRPSIVRQRHVVNAQEFVPGQEATSAIACWKGTVLASLHFEVLQRQHARGPSTVLRLIENAEMAAATEKMARRLELSGFHGFDFILQAQTGQAYLIEINPRVTQVGHLTLGPGRDLPAALYAAITAQVPRPAPKITENDTIALFPQEWMRNPASAFLRSGYHDVPWEEPEFVRACVLGRSKQSAWYSQKKWSQAFSRVRHPR